MKELADIAYRILDELYEDDRVIDQDVGGDKNRVSVTFRLEVELDRDAITNAAEQYAENQLRKGLSLDDTLQRAYCKVREGIADSRYAEGLTREELNNFRSDPLWLYREDA